MAAPLSADEPEPHRQLGSRGWLDRVASITDDRRWVTAAALTLGGLVVGVVGGVALLDPTPASIETRLPTVIESPPDVSDVLDGIHVHVAGEVERPGLYRLSGGDRVADAVAAAGGVTDVGDSDRLNLAALLIDGERIDVPRLGEPATAFVGPAPDSDGRVQVNRATAAELERLRGVGPALAAAIVTERERGGPFSSVDDLARVPGIGPAKIDGFRDDVIV